MAIDRTDDPAGVVQRRGGDPALLVSDFPILDRLTAVVVTPDTPALILGSTQAADSIEVAAADRCGLPRVRRRSGGGGVVVRPGAQVWVDIFVPAAHPLATSDVRRSALVAGSIWAEALRPLLRGELSIHDGALVETPWSRIDCFSGRGPGEVFLDDRKLVGVSQRRTRAGTWLFTQAHVRFDPAEHAAVARLNPAEREVMRAQLDRDVTTLPVERGIAEAAVVAAVAAMGG